MMQNEKPLPLSRMATIDKPSFWIFILVCVGIYIINKVLAPDRLNSSFTHANDLPIIGAAFTGLLLNILTVSLTNRAVTHALTITCYVFEAVSIIVLLFLIFSK